MKQVSIVRIEAARTKYGDRFWRTLTSDGERVSVFNSKKDEQNTAKFFATAGYGEMLENMTDNQVLEFKSQPISATVVPDGDYLKYIAVDALVGDLRPDETYTPNLAWYKSMASQRAHYAMMNWPLVFFDTETTGLDLRDEIISMVILSEFGDAIGDVKFQPDAPYSDTSEAAKITGITAADLAKADKFSQHTAAIRDRLNDKVWVGYNIGFDAQMVERSFMRCGAQMPFPMGLLDVMVLASYFIGEWEADKQKFKYWKLGEACEKLGIPLGEDAHDAGADIAATYKLLKKIAGMA